MAMVLTLPSGTLFFISDSLTILGPHPTPLPPPSSSPCGLTASITLARTLRRPCGLLLTSLNTIRPSPVSAFPGGLCRLLLLSLRNTSPLQCLPGPVVARPLPHCPCTHPKPCQHVPLPRPCSNTLCPCLMVVQPILVVNMRCRNFAMHALLASNMDDDLLCVTEPWFACIGVARMTPIVTVSTFLVGLLIPTRTYTIATSLQTNTPR